MVEWYVEAVDHAGGVYIVLIEMISGFTLCADLRVVELAVCLGRQHAHTSLLPGCALPSCHV